MLSDIGKNRIHRFLKRFGVRISSAPANKFSYDRANFDVGDSPLIFDVGANIGQSSLWFRASFPKATIYSFEPIDVIFQKLRTNVSNECFQIAFGPENASVRIAAVKDPYYQKASLKNSGTGDHFETIEVQTLDGFCDEKGIDRIDILKTDTEGYEIEVLTGAKGLLESGRLNYILAEATLVSKRHTHLFELTDFLAPYGYSLISIFDGHHVVRNGGLKYFNAQFCKDRTS